MQNRKRRKKAKRCDVLLETHGISNVGLIVKRGPLSASVWFHPGLKNAARIMESFPMDRAANG